MAHRLTGVVVQAAAPGEVGRFWAALLDRPPGPDVRLDDEAVLRFVPERGHKNGKNSIHLDLASSSLAHQAHIVDAALRLGARHVDIGQGPVPWTVLADPEGNEFCVLEPRDEYANVGAVAAVVIDTPAPVSTASSWSRRLGLPVEREHAEFASIRRDCGFWVEFVRVAPVSPRAPGVLLELDGVLVDGSATVVSWVP